MAWRSAPTLGPAASTGRSAEMKKDDIIRAWRDESFRRSLSPEQLAALPQHPAGELEFVGDAALASVTGGCISWKVSLSIPCGNSTIYASCDANGNDICI